MFDFQQKRKLRLVLNSPITQIITFILALMVLWSAYDRYLVAKEMSEKRAMLEKEIVELEERQKKLNEEVEYLSSERGVEAEARRQFDVVKEGEQVVIIVDEETATSTIEPLSSTTTQENRPWYKFW